MRLENLKSTSQCSDLYPGPFPTKHACEHFIRQNRSALIESGVLQIVNTRKFLDLEKLEPFLEELSARKLRQEA